MWTNVDQIRAEMVELAGMVSTNTHVTVDLAIQGGAVKQVSQKFVGFFAEKQF